MNWSEYIDGYCERLAPGFWAEPLNAVTNAAFLIAALVMWRRLRGAGRVPGGLLCAILAAIGLGSFLFHTHATRWAGLSDVVPIGVFILVYLFFAVRDFFGWRPVFALIATLAFIPYAAVATPIFAQLQFFHISNFYWCVPVLILLFAALLIRRAPATAWGLAAGGAVLILSITVRSLDQLLCPVLPMGTHFLWHLLNALMLGWMIEVYLRHRLAAQGARR